LPAGAQRSLKSDSFVSKKKSKKELVGLCIIHENDVKFDISGNVSAWECGWSGKNAGHHVEAPLL